MAPTDGPDPQRLADDYCEAYNAGDIEHVLGFISEETVSSSPDQPPLRGIEAHRKSLEAAFARESSRELTLKSTDSERVGDVLYDAGEWVNVFSPGRGVAPQSVSGYYLTVYRHQGGAWKILATLFNFRA